MSQDIELRRDPSGEAVEENIERLTATGLSYQEAERRAWALARAEMRKKLAAGIPVFEACELPGKEPMPLEKTRRAVDTYNRERAGRGPSHEGPAKITHRGISAEGWAQQLFMQGHTVYARFRDTSRKLLDGLIEGRFPNRSAELERGGRSFSGFAFLGGEAPAIRLPNFSANDDSGAPSAGQPDAALCFEFAAAALEINTTGADMTDTAKPKPDATVRVEFAGGAPASGASGGAGDNSLSFTAEQFAAEKQRIREEAEREFAAKQAQAEAQRQAQADTEFIEARVAAGTLPPGDREFAAGLLKAARVADSADGAQPLHFSEGGVSVRRTLAEELRRRLEAQPQSGLFQQHAPKGNSGLSKPAPVAPVGDGKPAVLRMQEQQQFQAQTLSYLRGLAREHSLSFSNAVLVNEHAQANGLDFAAALEQVEHLLPAEEAK